MSEFLKCTPNTKGPSYEALVGEDLPPLPVSLMTAEGAIPIVHGIVHLLHADAGAYTLAAPTVLQNGLMLILTNGIAAAHVITATGLLQDGTTGTHNTATSAAYVGATITLVAMNAKWNVVSNVGFTVA